MHALSSPRSRGMPTGGPTRTSIAGDDCSRRWSGGEAATATSPRTEIGVPRRVVGARDLRQGGARAREPAGTTAEPAAPRPPRGRGRPDRAASRARRSRWCPPQAAERSGRCNVEALVATALALRTSERDVAALLAAEAYRRWPEDPRTRAGTDGCGQAAGGFLGNAFVDGAQSTMGAVVPGTDRSFMVDDSGEAAIRDLETAELIMPSTPVSTASIHSPFPLVEVSADGTTGAILWPGEVEPSTLGGATTLSPFRGRRPHRELRSRRRRSVVGRTLLGSAAAGDGSRCARRGGRRIEHRGRGDQRRRRVDRVDVPTGGDAGTPSRSSPRSK